MKADITFFDEDVLNFSSYDYSAVEVLDVMKMSPAQRAEILETSRGSVIGAVCNSNVCLTGE